MLRDGHCNCGADGMSFWKKIFKNILWTGLSRSAGVAVSLASIGVLTRALGDSGYGQLSSTLAFMFLFSFLADAGLRQVLARRLGEVEEREEADWVSDIVSLRLVLLAVFLMIGALVVWFTPYPYIVKVGAVLAGLHFLFLSLSQLLMAVFQKKFIVYYGQVAEFLGRLLQLGVIVIGFLIGYGVLWMLGAYVAGALLSFLVSLALVWRWAAVQFHWRPEVFKQILKEALPIGIVVISSALYFRVDILLIGFFEPPAALAASSQAAVGFYNLGFKVLENLVFFPAVLAGLLLPEFSRQLKKGSFQNFLQLFKQGFGLLSLGGLMASVALFLLAKWAVLLLGGSEFLQAVPVLKILSGALFFITLATFFNEALIALKATKKLAAVFLGGLVFNVVANIIVIPSHSYIGAAWTTLVTEAFIAVALFGIIAYQFCLEKRDRVRPG